MIAHDGEETIVFHDAAGLRQVYWLRARTSDGEESRLRIAAGSPRRDSMGLSRRPRRLDYIASRGDSDTEVYWLPGDTSPYEKVRALLPNHLLRLDAQESEPVERYWPIED